MDEAEWLRRLTRDGERERMLATVLRALRRAVLSDDEEGLLRRLYRDTLDALRVTPARFSDWREWERWALGVTRALVSEGITLGDLADGLRVAIVARAPSGFAFTTQIVARWALLPELVVDDDGRVLNDERVIVRLIIGAMRVAGIGDDVRKDPYQYEKDKLGLRGAS